MGEIETVVIVGAGLAGAKAAEALRKDGYDGRVRLFGSERAPAVHPPAAVQGVPPRRRGAGPRLRAPRGVVRGAARGPGALDDGRGASTRRAHEIVLDGDRRVGFDRLVIATGSEPRRLDVPGADLEGVRSLRTLEDSDGLRTAAQAASHVVVIGGGWIGAEVAASIRQLGRDVTLIADTSVPLERVLGTEVGAIFGDVHAQHGVRIVANQRVVAVHGSGGRAAAVETTDGTRIDADLVVAGIGVVPRTQLAEAAGLDVDNGILVDERLETSVPGIFAAGDVANATAPDARVADPQRALGQRAAPGARRGAQRARPRRALRARAVLLLGPVRPEHGVRGLPGARSTGSCSAAIPPRGKFLAFWLSDGRVVAGMNVNTHKVNDGDLGARRVAPAGRRRAARRPRRAARRARRHERSSRAG